jgi:cytochrome P450
MDVMTRSPRETTADAPGHVGDFAFPSDETVECPYPFYASMRRETPVHRLPGTDTYFVSRWDDVVFAAEHPKIFSPERPSDAGLGTDPNRDADASPARVRARAARAGNDWVFSDAGLASCEGAEHRLKRRAALKLVSPERLRRHHDFIAGVVNDLIDSFIDRGQVEFASEFAAPLPMAVICEMLGVPRDDELFARVMRQAPASAVRFLSPAEREVRTRVSADMHAYMGAVVRERHAKPQDDFLSQFIAMHVEGRGELPLEYLIVEATTLLFGGLVTTQHMLTNTMELLLREPAQLQRVLADRSLIRPMLDESLRVESPFHLTETIATTDAELAGVTIPAGSTVYKLWGSGNRDEDKFEDPEAFRIDRPAVAKTHLGFGRGSHRCLGAPLALLEGKIAFEILLTRLRDIAFAPSGNDWRHVTVVSFRSLRELHLTFTAA